MTTYKSKPGPGLVIPLTIVLGSITAFFIFMKIWPALALLLFIDLFVIHMFATTYYQSDQSNLRINCGFLYDKTISVATIKKISETTVALASPATSFDRLEILFNNSDRVLISPKNKTGFMTQMTALNPAIDICIKKDTN